MTARTIKAPSVRDLAEAARYHGIEEIAAKAFDMMQPAERLTVAQCAQEYMFFGSGSGHKTRWSPLKTPYLIEPMNVLTSLDHQGMIFVGPARTGKTAMSLGWMAHTVITDPADMLYVQMDRENARKFSNGDLQRFLVASDEVRKRQLTKRQMDNTFDKTFESGMRFLLTYPTASNLSNITVGRVWLIDYERMDDDVGGEGTPFDMAAKRTQTFGRRGMTVAEASPNPNKEITDPKWAPQSPHQAPPIKGIFELYNRGDRRRFYWFCPKCGSPFEPDFKHLAGYEDARDMIEAREKTYMRCPVRGCTIEPKYKDAMNMKGVWVPDWARVDADGVIAPIREDGYIARSNIASFWLKGPAAGYVTWGELAAKYLTAMKALEDTGDDGPLRTTITVDQGSYYIPASRLSERSPEQLKEKAEDWGSTEEEPTIPPWVRFLVATIDVQKTCFVVQINGYTSSGDLVVIDGFKLRLSDRRNADGDRLPMDPAAYGEDWDILVREVMRKTYPLSDGSGRRMAIRATGCDSGGAEGVTTHAYNLWRRLKQTEDGLHRRFILVKGEPSKTAPRARVTWPDSSRKDKYAVARGDVPVLLLNSNLVKDLVSGMLARTVGQEDQNEIGVSGRVRFPTWTQSWFYNQMTTEIRTEKGWENPRRRRNESWDLSCYAMGIVVRPIEREAPWVHFGIERIDWANPPSWAAEWDDNDFVILPDTQASEVSKKKTGGPSFADLASKLA